MGGPLGDRTPSDDTSGLVGDYQISSSDIGGPLGDYQTPSSDRYGWSS